jgi:hypothetical protein
MCVRIYAYKFLGETIKNLCKREIFERKMNEHITKFICISDYYY